MLCKLVSVDEMQFGFMSERGTFDAVSVLRRMQEMCNAEEKKSYMFCGPRESFCRSTKVNDGMGNEEERNTRSFG